jgi:hypothetical protein
VDYYGPDWEMGFLGGVVNPEWGVEGVIRGACEGFRKSSTHPTGPRPFKCPSSNLAKVFCALFFKKRCFLISIP